MAEIIDRLRAVIRVIDGNVPRHDCPERFHEQKSDCVSQLKRIVADLEGGRGAD